MTLLRNQDFPVLVLEPDTALCREITAALQAPESREVVAVATLQEARDALATRAFPVIVSDLAGAPLLAQRDALLPDAALIMTGPFHSESHRYEIMGRGAHACLDRPLAMDRLRAAVDGAASALRGPGFHATLEAVGLVDLLQLLSRHETTGRMTLRSVNARGEIYIENGRLVHAATGTLVGRPAIKELLRWGGGACAFEKNVKSPEITVSHRQPEKVIIDCLRTLDEERRHAAAPAPDARVRELAGRVCAFTTGIAQIQDAAMFNAEGVVLASASSLSEGNARHMAGVLRAGLAAAEALAIGEPHVIEVDYPERKLHILHLQVGFLACWAEPSCSYQSLIAALKAM